MVKQVDTAEEFDKVLEEAGDKTVFIDFTATWCGPCKKIAPVFEKLAGDNSDCVFIKVDVDKNEAIAARFKIEAMPTFIAIKKKAEVDKMMGADQGKLEGLVSKNK